MLDGVCCSAQQPAAAASAPGAPACSTPSSAALPDHSNHAAPHVAAPQHAHVQRYSPFARATSTAATAAHPQPDSH
eukprot:5812582-Lingulodinium_polyedra.AAC.1